MPFRKGISGNPRGRPKKGESFADLVRRHWTVEMRKQSIQRIAELAGDAHKDGHLRVKAFDALRRAGWPEEQRGEPLFGIPLVPLFALPVGIQPDMGTTTIDTHALPAPPNGKDAA